MAFGLVGNYVSLTVMHQWFHLQAFVLSRLLLVFLKWAYGYLHCVMNPLLCY